MQTKKKTGRPQKEFDLKQVEIFGKFRATYQTMAEYFGCSEKTIERRMADENDDFCRVYKKAFSGAKLKLSENQFKLAEKSAAMAIWLGKQYLGQKDTAYLVDTSDDTDNKLKFDGWND